MDQNSKCPLCGGEGEEERWKALAVWIKGYILFDKIDRHSGNVVLALMEDLDVSK